MGIPRFYRYMSERYPLLNQPISDVSLLPEFDCFYLDMNGIIHNCTHSDGDNSMSTLSLQAQLHGVFTYMDRLITHIIKPQQLVYIAIDGVAPRAKLNQQRSRRFRAGLERQEAMEKERHMQITLEDEKNGHTAKPPAARFDSNCITPGTEFLAELSQHLVYFVRQKMKTDPIWARLEVFFSGSEVPGEGEHKIVEFIRHRKMMPGYGANVRHCMYGSDADLMLLGIMTHEPHFTLVRETVVWGSHKQTVARKQIEEQQWQLVHLSLFREYLMMEMRVAPPLDGERMLDDFILLTFLLGNDFIPHSPTLEISEDAIPLLLRVYRQLLETHGGEYLTENGKLINIKLLQELFQIIGDQEEEILINRAVEESKRRRNRRGGERAPQSTQHEIDETQVHNALAALRDDDDDDAPPPLLDDDELDEDEAEKALLEALDGEFETKVALEIEESEREVLMLTGSESFQETKWNYYERKFKIPRGNGDANNSALVQVKKHYLEALKWVLAYYFQGPPSWSWFYPYHYAPMVSDLTDIEDIANSIVFQNDPETDGPLLPFEQLMSNLPSTSAHLVPEPYRFLMVSPLSPIKHFYPETFEIDMEGKRNAWEGVNLLPFIDVALLKQAIAQYCPDSRLSQAELKRNRLQWLPLRIVRDMNAVETLRSTLPGVNGFPDIPFCNTRVEQFTLPKISVHEGQFQSRLMDGVVLPLAGFPSLYTVQLEAVRIASVGLNCFGMASRKDSLILQLPPSAGIHGENAVADPQGLLGTTVLANWPNLHEGLVVGVSNVSGEYRLSGGREGQVVFNPYDPEQKTAWAYYAQTEVVKLLSGRGTPGSGGIDLGKTGITTVLHVLPLQGMVSNPLTGAIEKKFGEVEAMVPYQLTVINHSLFDARFQETGKQPLAERFPVDSVALITRGQWLGCTAIVKDHDDAKSEVTVHVNTIDKEPPFGYVIATQITDKYYPGYLVAQKLGISASTLGTLAGSVYIKPGDYEIGLNFRFRKELLLPGYCRLVDKASQSSRGSQSASSASDDENVWRKGDIVKIVGSSESSNDAGARPSRNGNDASSTAWEYTERAMQVIAAYMKEFPEVVANLSRLPYARSYRGSDVFGVSDAKKVEVKAELVKQWIERQKLGNKDHSKHIPISSQYLSLNAIRAIEAAGSLRAKEREKNASKLQTQPVAAKLAPVALFRPNPLVNQDLTGREVSARASMNPGAPRLGDRVINISARGVPFGHRGTVVATHVSSKCVEVLFDEGFTGGEALYGSMSLDRGKIVSWNTLLCVSTPPGEPQRHQRRNDQHNHNSSSNRAPQQARSSGAQKNGPANTQAVTPSKTKVLLQPSMIIGRKVMPPKQPAAAPAAAVPPPPPVPSSLPPPPDPEKIQMLISKWSHNGEAAAPVETESKPDEKTVETSAPKPDSNASGEAIAPSVAAFFSAAETTSTASGNASIAPPPPPPSQDLLNLFPHNYQPQPTNSASVLAPPLPQGYPYPPPPGAYYAGHPPPPPPMHQPYHPHPGTAFVRPDGSLPPAFVPTQYNPQPPAQPAVDTKEFPSLSEAASGGKSKKASRAPETKPTNSTEATVGASGERKQTHHAGGRGGRSSHAKGKTAAATSAPAAKWVPKASMATDKPKTSLLMPAQLLKHQQKQIQSQQQ